MQVFGPQGQASQTPFNPVNDPAIQRLRAITAPQRLTMSGQVENPFAPQGLDYLTANGPDNPQHVAIESARYQRLGQEAGVQSPEQNMAMNAFNRGQVGHGVDGVSSFAGQYGTGSVHHLQPGEQAQPAQIGGQSALDFFAQHPQPNSNVTPGDMEFAQSHPGQDGSGARDYIASNSSPSHPMGAQAPMGPPKHYPDWQNGAQLPGNRPHQPIQTNPHAPISNVGGGTRAFPPTGVDASWGLPLTGQPKPAGQPLMATQAFNQPEEPQQDGYKGGLDTQAVKQSLMRLLANLGSVYKFHPTPHTH